MADGPRVSVVTPFFNTGKYLAECIESVLAQTLGDYEYLLVNNLSTDGSREIAARYAEKDPRIRLVDNEQHVGQVENYNGALARIDRRSRWVKMVQADDALLPECLARMVEVGERDPRIALVASFYLKGDEPRGAGIPLRTSHLNGREVARRMLLEEFFPIGSPSAVLYRADVVRARRPFYALGRYHEDTEAAYEILLEHDFGFVHQVLSFLRTDNISIMSAARRFNPAPLDHLIALHQYGRKLLTEAEFEQQWRWEWNAYMNVLGAAALKRREAEFWAYHRKGLAMIGREISRVEVAAGALRRLAGARRVLDES
jgi:glycosyltransferase involved in cell wall biosynthesis